MKFFITQACKDVMALNELAGLLSLAKAVEIDLSLSQKFHSSQKNKTMNVTQTCCRQFRALKFISKITKKCLL